MVIVGMTRLALAVAYVDFPGYEYWIRYSGVQSVETTLWQKLL